MEEYIYAVLFIVLIVGLFISMFRQDQLKMEAFEALARYKAKCDADDRKYQVYEMLVFVTEETSKRCTQLKMEKIAELEEKMNKAEELIGLTDEKPFTLSEEAEARALLNSCFRILNIDPNKQ